MIEALYKCKFCRRGFGNERIFMKHTCTPMRRSQEIQTVTGTMAYGLYKRWLEKQRRTAPPIETFVTSAYYTAFTKFSQWVRDTSIPDPEKYVELMVASKISPINWRRTEAYNIYLEYVDQRSGYLEQATVTAETLITLAEGWQVPAGEVFKKLKVAEMVELVSQRRLSPWLLFCSTTFKNWYSSLDPHDHRFFMENINITYWQVRLERAPRSVIEELKLIATELEI